ncbi:kinase-like domain-containing protein [Aspergillus stella-maris]|uniref:kinase-like domain-containing protein n=1 Tax=Aspergillus stella-maris TaxID=1810926 RepID=UPI003CCCCCE6
MDIARRLPDLVNDTKLLVELHDSHAVHFLVGSDGPGGQRMRRTWRQEKWARKKLLGGGATGEVWLEECHSGTKKGQLQAVKVISKTVDFDVYEELETIAKFSQNSSKYEGLFVKSHGWFESEQSVFIVMEYIEHGSLATHLTHPLPEDEAGTITVQILEGLVCLHANEFVHRDLKPHNILVASKSPDWWVKIGDFGFSKRVGGDSSLRSFVGTPKYLAPEVLGLKPHLDDFDSNDTAIKYRCTNAMDMWSLGVMVYYMLCHDFPYRDRHFLQYLRDGSLPELDLPEQPINQDSFAFIKRLLTIDPMQRLTAASALEHRWLNKFNGRELLQRSVHTLSIPRSHLEAPTLTTNASASWGAGSWGSNSTSTTPAPAARPQNQFNAEDKKLQDLRDLHENGLQLIAQKEYVQAGALLEQAADGRKQALHPYHKDTLSSMQQLGIAYFYQERYKDAQKTLQFAMDGQNKSLGSTHADTLSSNYWISQCLFAQRDFGAAEKVIDRLVEIQKSVLGVQNDETIKSLHLSGKTQVELGNHDDAIMLLVEAADAAIGTDSESASEVNESLVQYLCERGRYEEAKMLLEQLVNPLPMEPRGSQLMSHLLNAGKLLYDTGKYASAESCFEKVSTFREELYGLFHEQTLDATLRLAYSLAKTGKAGKVKELLAENGSASLPLDRKIPVINHIFEVGKILWGKRAYAEAYGTFDQVVRERKQFQFQGDRHTLVAASWMGRSLLGPGQYNDATSVLKSVLKEQPDISWVSIDGIHSRSREAANMVDSAWKEHSDDVWARYLDAAYTSLWLGESLHYQGKREESHTYIRRAYYMTKQCLGDSHEDTIRSMRCYGSSQGTLDEFWAAQHTLALSLKLATRILGTSHEEYIRGQVNYGKASYANRDETSAFEEFRSAAEKQTRTLGQDHKDTLDTMCCIATVLNAWRRYDQSEKTWRHITEARQRALGMRHRDTQAVMRSLGLSLSHQGKWDEASGLFTQVLEAREATLASDHPLLLKSRRDVEKCKKVLAGKWVFPLRHKRRKLEYRHL